MRPDWILLLIIVASSTIRIEGLRLVDNGYEDLYIVIQETVSEDPQLLDRIQVWCAVKLKRRLKIFKCLNSNTLEYKTLKEILFSSLLAYLYCNSGVFPEYFFYQFWKCERNERKWYLSLAKDTLCARQVSSRRNLSCLNEINRKQIRYRVTVI